MGADEFWVLERRFWLEGPSFYEAHLHENAVMIFPAMGVLDRTAIIEGLRDAPRWTRLDMFERQILRPDGVFVLAYRAEARRGQDHAYCAFCSSLYLPTNSGWKMLTHQQTPAPGPAEVSDAP